MNLHSHLYLKVQWSFLGQWHQIILLSKEGGKVLYTNLKMLVSSMSEIKYTELMWVGELQVKKKGKFRLSTQRKQRTQEKVKRSFCFDTKETWASWFPKQRRQQILTFIKTHIGAFSTFCLKRCAFEEEIMPASFLRVEKPLWSFRWKTFLHYFLITCISFPFHLSHLLLSMSTISRHSLIPPPYIQSFLFLLSKVFICLLPF